MQTDLSDTKPSSNKHARIFACVFGQKKKNRYCPLTPRLDGKRALVTGGAAGVGEYVSRGLIDRGANVITLARGYSQKSGVMLAAQNLHMDLSDLDSIVDAVNLLGTEPIHILICNAGVLSQKSQLTSSKVERTFAVNVLGHHLLYRLLIERNLLAKNAKIVITSGEIYISANQCSASIPFDKTDSTYARSKLGNLWQVAELTERYLNLHPIAVHPGVVASGFTGAKHGFMAWVRSKLLISENAGAQASLIGATQNLPRGSYWHNTLGLLHLEHDDPALDSDSAKKLWDELETLIAPYLHKNTVPFKDK